MMLHGIGAYPSDAYFDPNRARFLPYWIDTPTESAMKWGMYAGADTKIAYPLPPRPQAPPVPAGGYSGAVVDPAAVNAVVDASASAYRSDVQQHFSDVGTGLDIMQSEADRASAMRILWFAAAGVAVLLLVRR